jgi:hypothetical protein
MKKICIIGCSLVSTVLSAQVKIGDNPTTIGNSSLLELESTNKALVLPRVTNTSAITNPVNGMMVYDLSSNCAKSYENGAWSLCLSGGGPSAISANCDPTTNGFQGVYAPGEPVSTLGGLGAKSFKVTLVNNSLFEGSITPSTSDVTLSGASGLTIASVSPSTTTTIAGGGSLTITYTLGGTVPSTGVVTATFAKAGLTCTNTLDVSVTPTLKTILTTCTQTATGTGLSSWQSNNTGNATINSSTGFLTGVAAGNVYIYALKTGTNYSVAKQYTVAAKVVTANATGSSSLTIPGTDIVSFQAEAYGAGGGGGGGCGGCAPDQIGGSAGSGAYTRKLYNVSSGNTSISYTVGSGGGGAGVSGWGANGTSSTVTYASNTITAGGGGGGRSASPFTAGSAGTASGGDVNTNGNSGVAGASFIACNVSGRVGVAGAGPSGSSGGGAGGTSSAGNGGNGTQPGGSGAGGGVTSPCGDSTGGSGGNGRVVITYTCP